MANNQSAKRLPSRYLILAAAAFGAMGTGLIYIWSIFNKPLMAQFNYTTSEVSMVYSLFLLASFCGSFLAGWMQNHVRSRYIVLLGGMLLGFGWFSTGYANSLPLLYLSFSACAGLGNGFLYNTIVSVVTKWFPDQRGLANGICIGAIGMSSFIFAPLGNSLISFFDVQSAFRIVGVTWIVIYLVFSWLLQAPPEGWQPPVKGASSDSENAEEPGPVYQKRNLTVWQMLRTPLFYFLLIAFTLANSSGMMISSNASNIAQDFANLSASDGAVAIMAVAVGSTAGRFLFGTLSDRLGRFNVLFIVMTLNAANLLLIMPQATNLMLFLVGVALIGACFGGSMTVVPALTADLFGSEHFGQNYSLVYAGCTLASFIGPPSASIAFDTMGTYLPAFIIAGVLSIVGLALFMICKRLDAKMD